MPSDSHQKSRPRYRDLLVILALSLAFRVLLIWGGGQYFLPDEIRYEVSRKAARAFWAGEIREAIEPLRSADHLLFKVIGTIPASLELALGANLKIPACFFALFSVASIGLTWAIARRLGDPKRPEENERVALFAAGALALATTLFYFSRHLQPYDMAMSFGLLALYLGVRRPWRFTDSLLCGSLAAATFLTYNGYWILAGFAMLAHTLKAASEASFAAWTRVGRCLIAGGLTFLAFAGSIATLLVADWAANGTLLQQFTAFSGTVTQGTFAEGWSLPFYYLWNAEHLIVLLWLAAFVFAVFCLIRGQRGAALLGVGAIVFVYGALVVFSVGLEKFVVYGRLVRQLVPFSCLLVGLLLEWIWTSGKRGRVAGIAILLACVVQAGYNVRRPFKQIFPFEFQTMAFNASAEPAIWEYRVLNAEYIYPEPKPAPEGATRVLAQPHPLEFRPYQYEGFTPQQRVKLRSTDIALQLVRIPKNVEVFEDGFESGDTGAWSATVTATNDHPPK